MLRPPKDMSDLMVMVAQCIKLEEIVGGPDLMEVAEQSKPMAKEMKQVNTVAQKRGNNGGNRGNNKTWDRLPRDGHDYLAITTNFKEPIYRILHECCRVEGFRWLTEKMGTAGA